MNFQRRIALGMMSLTALYSGSALALGLGELQLQSALHQPLQGIIQLHDTEGLSPADISVSLADAAAFAQVGIDRPYFLTDLRFTPTLLGQQLVIRVESSQPVREPYLNFLVQLKRANGSLMREYTLLLDPPLYTPTPVVASSSQPAPAVRPSTPAPRQVRSGSAAQSGSDSPARPAPAPRAQPVLQPQPGAAHYQTVAGDSLWSIAAATRVNESVSLQRQMDAIHALNPHAFVNGEPGRLRTGQQLTLPVAEQVGASGAAVAPPSVSTPTPVPEAVVQPAAGDRLRIEDLELLALNEETEELQDRLQLLESRFHGLLAELEVRDVRIAELQTELETLRQARQAESQAGAAVGLNQGQPGTADPQLQVEQAAAGTPGAIDSSNAQELSNQTQPSWIERWWPALLALIAVLIGTLLLRPRRQPEPEQPRAAPAPVPQPVTIPGSRTVDPLEGVELYLTYGRLPEARLMLDKAIAAEPQRADLRLRQLSVLAELGEGQSFAEQAAEARELGVEQLQIDLIKARYPQLLQSRQDGMAEQYEPLEPLYSGDDTLNLDSDELEQSWDLLDDMDGLGARRKESAALPEEPFESNLQDFPEVGELDGDESLDPAERSRS